MTTNAKAHTSTLIRALKATLNSRSLTYDDLAGRLQLSHASVKRLFAEEGEQTACAEENGRGADHGLIGGFHGKPVGAFRIEVGIGNRRAAVRGDFIFCELDAEAGT